MPAVLLDTNVVSELVKPTPNQHVIDWMAGRLAVELHLSAVTVGELMRGATRLPEGRRRAGLLRWIGVDLHEQFDWDRKGRQRSAIDTQIAAIAIRFDCVLATRDVRDFQGTGVALVDPWHDP